MSKSKVWTGDDLRGLISLLGSKTITFDKRVLLGPKHYADGIVLDFYCIDIDAGLFMLSILELRSQDKSHYTSPNYNKSLILWWDHIPDDKKAILVYYMDKF